MGRRSDLVARRLRGLLDAHVVSCSFRPDGHRLTSRRSPAWTPTGFSAGRVRVVDLEEQPGYATRKRGERIDALLDDPRSTGTPFGAYGARTAALYVPLSFAPDVGVIAVDDKVGPDPRFSDDDVRLARDIRLPRRGCGRSLANASRAKHSSGSSTPRRLERRRLARELHDETGQALASILLGLKALERRSTARRPCLGECASWSVARSTTCDG